MMMSEPGFLACSGISLKAI